MLAVFQRDTDHLRFITSWVALEKQERGLCHQIPDGCSVEVEHCHFDELEQSSHQWLLAAAQMPHRLLSNKITLA